MAKTKTAASTKTTRTKAAVKPAAKKAVAKKKTPAKKVAKKPAAKKSAAELGDEEVKLDRRRAEQRAAEAAETVEVAETAATEEPATEGPKLERREKVNRRRQIDPTTCERDYSDQEVEFMNALDAYKRSSGRMFPTCSEVLEVIRGIGYVKLTPAELTNIKADRGETEAPADLEASAESEAEEAFADSEELRID